MEYNRKWIRICLMAACLWMLSCSTIGNILSLATPTPTITPSPTPRPFPTADEMVGTRWTVSYYIPGEGSYDHEMVFRENGRLEFRHPNDTTPDNDTWEMAGSQVILSINDSFVTYTGEFIDYDTISGIAVNVRGLTWDWTAHRK
jgi:hypothetical protein